MQPFKSQRLKEWWSNLAAREQQAVMAGGAAVVVFLIYQLLWSPLSGHADNLRKKIETQQRVLTWMRAADRDIREIEQGATPGEPLRTPVALLSVLQAEVEKKGLVTEMQDLKQTSSDTVEMRFQKVSFDKLMRFLLTIVTGRRVTITQLSITAEPTPGIVSANVAFKLA